MRFSIKKKGRNIILCIVFIILITYMVYANQEGSTAENNNTKPKFSFWGLIKSLFGANDDKITGKSVEVLEDNSDKPAVSFNEENDKSLKITASSSKYGRCDAPAPIPEACPSGNPDCLETNLDYIEYGTKEECLAVAAGYDCAYECDDWWTGMVSCYSVAICTHHTNLGEETSGWWPKCCCDFSTAE
jgi:hypothetical protein